METSRPLMRNCEDPTPHTNKQDVRQSRAAREALMWSKAAHTTAPAANQARNFICRWDLLLEHVELLQLPKEETTG